MVNKPQCIVFANLKGGTGKTTSCLSIGGFLSRMGHKVLIIDLDPQNNATRSLGLNSYLYQYSTYDLLIRNCNGSQYVPLNKVIQPTKIENLDIAPSEYDLVVAEVIIQRCPDKTMILNQALEEIRPFYDFILIDTPPSSGLLSINGLCAADSAVLSFDPGYLSVGALEMFRKLLDDIYIGSGHTLGKITVILDRYIEPNIFVDMFGKPNASQEAERILIKMFGSIFLVPEDNAIYEAQKKGLPISHHAPRSMVGRAYEKIARRLISVD